MGGNVIWADVTDPTSRDFEELAEEFGFHHLSIEDCQVPHCFGVSIWTRQNAARADSRTVIMDGLAYRFDRRLGNRKRLDKETFS